MAETHDDAAGTAARAIVRSRVFHAPRELVFQAWTSAEHLAHWWGPNGFSTTTYEMSFQVGGVWRFTMHGPDGTDYPNAVVYTAIVPPERSEYDHGTGDGPAHFHVAVIFAAQGDSTELTMHMLFPTVEACEAAKQFGAVEGGNQTLSRLAAYLDENAG